MTKIALYAGSFDPPTRGHLWVIREAAELFDVLYVADGVNPQKAGRYMFSSEERVAMLKLITKDLPNVKVVSLGMRMQYQVAREVGAKWIVTGERNTDDFLANLAVQNFHERQAPELKTLRITPPVRIRDISSSFAKGLLGYENWEEELKREDCLPEEVYPFLIKKLAKNFNCRKEEE